MRPYRARLLFRVFFTYVVTAFLVIAVLMGVFRWFFDRPERTHLWARNLNAYAESVVHELGEPPSEIVARRLFAERGLAVRVEESDGRTWAVPEDLPHVSDFVDQRWAIPGARWGRANGRGFLLLERGSRRYLFTLGEIGEGGPPQGLFLALSGFVIFIFIISFYSIHLMLKPMRVLTRGVERIGAGDLDYRIRLLKHGEFRNLAEAFNGMAEKVSDMVRGRERLLRDVSHELRSPLARMQVASAMVPDEKLRDGLKMDIREMDALITEILESHRLQSEHGGLRKEKFNACDLVTRLVSEYSARGERVIARCPESTLEVNWDMTRMERVLRNLIENAIRHTPAGSVGVEVELRAETDSVLLEVRDHGEGISAEDLAHVFEPFYRADRSRDRRTGGYGLGLSLVKTIIEAHSGQISLKSELGSGTQVLMTLPMEERRA